MLMAWLLAGVGLVILMVAGDALVKGAVNLALRAGIPALIVSLTVVAFGTSAPELLVSIDAVLRGAPGIALGNVVGSNTANVLLVLGLPALVATLATGESDTRSSFLKMIAASTLFIALAFTGTFQWWGGLILLSALGLILYSQFRRARQHRRDEKARRAAAEEEIEGADPSISRRKIALFLGIGIIGLPIGAELLVKNASIIARDWGLSDAVIGLTLVALGTSLPELATTIMAAYRRQTDLALGNVIGSNMFNLLAITGIASLVGPIPVAQSFLEFDLWVMLGASLLLFPFVYLRWNFGRLVGLILTSLYLFYVIFELMH